MNYNIPDFPIKPYLDNICSTLKNSPSRFLVLTAQTAAGKSTCVPLALLNYFKGKILMLEPRRIAAVAIAGRVASLLNENVGETSGYTLHLESKTSEKTRFEVITEAILTRRLQNDPSLEGVDVVILDEFHERSVHADLALTFLKEAMELRNNLYVIIMSATMDVQKIASFLSTPQAPILNIPGKQFPVDIIYNDKISVEDAILEEIPPSKGKVGSLPANHDAFRNDTILVFLPGIFEINKTKQALQDMLIDSSIDIMILHSSVPLKEQKEILTPVPFSNPQRIILSSSIAETSLTIPGVSTVIDSGFSRINRLEINSGLNKLVTEKISLFNAEQRAGRAGRIQKGKCIRLWNKYDVLKKETEPEILRSDLTSVVLECAQWGSVKIDSFLWLDKPSFSSWKSSLEFLKNLNLIDEEKITENGKSALRLGLSPRYANILLYGKKTNHLNEALQLILKYSEFSNSSKNIQEKFSLSLENRLKGIKITGEESFSQTKMLLSGFPDRIAKKISSKEQNLNTRGKTIYQLSSGKNIILKNDFNLSPEYLLALETVITNNTPTIFEFFELKFADLEPWLLEHSKTFEKIEFVTNSSKIIKKQITAFESLVLSEKILPASENDYGKAICNQIEKEGLVCLSPDEQLISFLTRAAFYARIKDPTLLDKIQTLQFKSTDWLLPFIHSTDISSRNIYDSLFWYLDGDNVNKYVPEIYTFTNGKKARISYETTIKIDKLTIDSFLTNVRSFDITPNISIIIQQIFGVFSTPTILGKKILLNLLSPARRPLQITDDLENFWTGSWNEICKEMKGRYPKHNWDYKKTTD